MNLELQKGSRTRVIAVLIAIIMAIFVVRLFQLQVLQHSDYVAKAEAEQVKQLVIPSSRGEIYVMDGDKPTKLVLNETIFTVFVDPQIIDEKDKALRVLKDVAGGNLLDGVEEAMERKNSRYQIVARNVTKDQAEMIKKEGISGIGFQKETRRVYPEGQLAGQTLGFVNAEGKAQYGVEQALDERLKGKDGMLESVTDVSNVPLTLGDNNIRIPARDGDDIALTIDRNVQAYVERTLAASMKKVGADKGSVLVMEPQTGRVMAMANLPTYNPGEYFKVQDAADFVNSAVASPYEPGSVIKAFTMATAIDKGVASPESTYNNTDSIRVYDATIHNATRGQTGNITMQHAFNWSLNTGMVTLAQRISGGDGDAITRQGRDIIYHYFHDRFRLGQETNIEIAGEVPGLVISPNEVQGNAVRYSNMVFGQGLEPTTIQVASAFSSMINGGKYYQPTVVRGVVNDDGQLEEQRPKVVSSPISESTSQTMRQVLESARQEFYSKNDRPGYAIGSKTGTSEALVDGDYTTDQTIATYLGYGGDDMPRYVIMVRISGDGVYLGGGDHAHPIFTDISNWMIDYLKLQPKG